MQRCEREVLQLPLDRVDPEPVRQGSEDLERLARLLLLLLLRQRADRAHVVEAVGQLDQDHPDVGGHRHHHLAVVLGLPLVAALEGDLGELGDAVDQLSDLVAEGLADLVEAGARVLDRVVQQGRAERGRVEAQARADAGDAERVGDEVLPRLSLLAGMALAGEGEGALDLLTVDGLRGVGLVLLDDGEEVAEQRALVGGQLAGDRVGPGRAVFANGLSDTGVAAAILIANGTVSGDGIAVAGVGYVCALACRNRMASWCLARQDP